RGAARSRRPALTRSPAVGAGSLLGKGHKIGTRCINAMAETVASRPAFRDAFARGQRCIVPVDAFYEWKKIGAAKQPYAIVGADGLPLATIGAIPPAIPEVRTLMPTPPATMAEGTA